MKYALIPLKMGIIDSSKQGMGKSMTFRYPKSLAEKYNPKCEVIEAAFTPSWKTDYKIWG